MDTWQYDQILATQQNNVGSGTLVYERGIQIVEKTGYILVGPGGYIFFIDQSKLIREQQSLFVPYSRVIEIQWNAEPLLLGETAVDPRDEVP